jgi:serine/threonine protein kinase/predicted negative regulator of RcsB-dependent stress response
MGCPDNSVIAELVERRLGPHQVAGLEVHLAECVACRQLVGMLARSGSSNGSDDTVPLRNAGPVNAHARDERKQRLRELVPVDPQYYEVGEEIARGGMGRIRFARDLRLGRAVAIKELLTESADLRARFEREARITAQLQHPAIVNVLEAGTWPSGEPFYVMKLVTGESLDKVIAGRDTLDARLGMLPTVIAAVDALAYAHSMRVIHRDLKPANVLVGEFGETVVIDWGLAKDLADATTDNRVGLGPYRTWSAHAETQAGEVMGTPAYMPPEQALGEPVDARADVYSLGAILYHVLAGAPPYVGTSGHVILDAVIAGPPPPLDERVPGVPQDLVTIVNKAMAHAATDRYANAKELADDLKKFQTGQLVGAHRYSPSQLLRRWARRHRAVIAVGSIAVAVLVLIAVVSMRSILREEKRANVERRTAVKLRGDAEELLDFMLFDLRAKLEPLGKLELLRTVATKATDYYGRQPASVGVTEQDRRVVALRNLADIQFQQGDTTAALAALQFAQRIARELATAAPEDDAAQRSLMIGYGRLGEVQAVQGDLKAALTTYRSALAIAQSLAAKRARDSERDLSVAYIQVGKVMRAQGDRAAAMEAFAAAHAIRQTLAAAGDPDARSDLAMSHRRIGELLAAGGDTTRALAAYRDALRITQLLVQHDPSNATWLDEHAGSQQRVGDMLVLQGDTIGGLAMYRDSIAIFEKLAASDPTNMQSQRNLHVLHESIGDLFSRNGDAKAAAAAYNAGLAIGEQLARTDPASTSWAHGLVYTHAKIGQSLYEQGDRSGALASYKRALIAVDEVADREPDNTDVQRSRSVVLRMTGELQRTLGDLEAAHEAYSGALAISHKLAQKQPAGRTERRDIYLGQIGLGDVELARKQAGAALSQFRAALAAAEVIAAADPSEVTAKWDIAEIQRRIGDASLALGNREQAHAAYRHALALTESLAAADPSNASLRDEAAALRILVKTCCRTRRR